MAHKFLDLEKLLRVPYVAPETGFDISPDGRKIAFSWNRSGQWEVYELELSNPEQICQLTGGPGGKFGPHYSPDGTRLAYTVDVDGSESFDLWRLDFASGQATNLTPETPFALQPNTSWSPDGAHIAILADWDSKFDAYILPAEGGELTKVSDLGAPNMGLDWSPDGQWLAVTAESQGQDFATYLVGMERFLAPTRPALQVSYQTISLEGELINAKEPAWSPDSSRLAFSSDAGGRYRIGMLLVEQQPVVAHPRAGASAQIEWLEIEGCDLGQPDWSPDGQSLACVISQGPETWLGVHRLGQAGWQRFQIEPGLHFTPRFTPDGQGLVCVFDSPRYPDDLWLLNLQRGEFTPLTHSLPPELNPGDFIVPQHIWYDSPDGHKVPALLYLPSTPAETAALAAALSPALIVIHGGPSWLFQYLWYPFMAHCASRGWVVLAANYRGSTGYGREWQYANRYEMGRADTLDVAAGVDYLVENGLADPQRIGVTGRSHGGFLTMSCLTQYPEKFAVGSAVVPFLNWFTSHVASRGDCKHWDIENMGDPVENAELWHERSPFFFLERIQAPVQLICGANDPRCPASESIAAREALESLGKPVELVLYPDEGHGFLKIENVVDHELRRAGYLASYLDRYLANENEDKEVSR